MPIGAFKLNSIAKYLAPTALRPKTITVNGNAQVSTAQSKFGGASALFDGSGDYLNTAVYSDLNSASSDVTWECWIYVNNVTGAKIVMGGRYDYEPLIYLSGSTLRLYLSSNGTSWNLVNGATFGTLAINTWYHIAFVRNGTTVKTYRDGVEQSSTAVSTTAIWWTSTPQLYIGCIDPTLSNAFWNGYIDEVRISSTARYTAAFTPATSPFISDANTVFLMHANGTNGSTVFTDDNGVRNSSGISSTGITISNTQSKFGGTSAYFNGTAGNQLFINSYDSSGITSAFTWESWVYFTDTTTENYAMLYMIGGGNTDYRQVYVGFAGAGAGNTGVWVALGQAGASSFLGFAPASNFVTNTWYHIAVSRTTGNDIRAFVNGSQIGSTVNNNRAWTNQSSNDSFTIGRFRTDVFRLRGYLDEYRISKSARYTANFTAPTTAFTNDANTVFLMHADGTNTSTTFTDDNS